MPSLGPRPSYFRFFLASLTLTLCLTAMPGADSRSEVADGNQSNEKPAVPSTAEASERSPEEAGPVEKATQADTEDVGRATTLKALRERLAELEARIAALSGQLSESRSEAGRVEEELKVARARAEVRATDQQRVAELEAARAADRARVAELEQRLAELQTELVNGLKQSAAIEKALTATQREAGSVESEQEDLRKLLQAQGLQIAAERRRVEELESRLSGLVAELSESREDIGLYQSQIEAYQEDISRYRDELRGNSEELLRYREALDAARGGREDFLATPLGSFSAGQAAMVGAALVLLLLSTLAMALLTRRSAKTGVQGEEIGASEDRPDRQDTTAPREAEPAAAATPAPEPTSRRAESESLAVRKDAPRGRLLALAMDEIEVAIPILVKSASLSDNDLISIVKQKTSQHRLAIAMRRQLSAPVIEALIEAGETKIVAALLDNDSIQIERGAQEKLLMLARRLPALKAAIAMHPGTPMSLAARLQDPAEGEAATWETTAPAPNPQAEVARAATAEEEEPPLWASLTELPQTESERPATATAPVPDVSIAACEEPAEGDVPPHALIESLRKGKMELFEALFSRMTGLRPPRLQQVVYGPGGEELAVACRAQGLSKPVMTSIFIWSRKGHRDLGPVEPRELSKAMTVYDETSAEAARQMVAAWTLQTSFPAALAPDEPTRAQQGPAAE